jgi:hypothetical protein
MGVSEGQWLAARRQLRRQHAESPEKPMEQAPQLL